MGSHRLGSQSHSAEDSVPAGFDRHQLPRRTAMQQNPQTSVRGFFRSVANHMLLVWRPVTELSQALHYLALAPPQRWLHGLKPPDVFSNCAHCGTPSTMAMHHRPYNKMLGM